MRYHEASSVIAADAEAVQAVRAVRAALSNGPRVESGG